MIKIYDPREAQDYRVRYFDGGQFSSWQSDCLVVTSEDQAVFRNADLLRRLILTFPSEFICLHAVVARSQFIRRPKLEKKLGKRSSEKRSYFAAWEYTNTIVEHLVDCFDEFSRAEHWAFGLYSAKFKDEVASLRLTGTMLDEDFLKNIRLFEYIAFLDLSDYYYNLVMRNESHFDAVIKFFEDSGLSPGANRRQGT